MCSGLISPVMTSMPPSWDGTRFCPTMAIFIYFRAIPCSLLCCLKFPIMRGEGNPISSPDAFCCTFRCHLMHSSYHTHGLIETKLHRFSEILSILRVIPKVFRKFQERWRQLFTKCPVHSRLFLAENDILAVQKNSVILCVRKPCNNEEEQVT